ncbi:hypothetical protein DBR11_00055 [Pedobacter sp. HMWF019]|uniref:MauE/DoxX family redox-associated membrane protein n=1 Tax=Pedobacter sp. HMWF019 TaxID=2056856 RepID=UPI000D3D38FF|nr:MauE/DoxX family redox-associated membrane protein [Pedobacter sp. HMWF019]PTT04260.1 hypothetical protein DBR11_00055 [Pedobacter sp. HMWF019]
MKKDITIDVISYAIILLFVYAALSKLFMYNIYVYDLNRSPFIAPYASLLSLTLPVTELSIAALLLFERTRLYGLYGATILMILFTIYVGAILGFVPNKDKPCTCGGLIRELTWPQHFIFNIFYTVLAASGIWLQRSKTSKRFAQ